MKSINISKTGIIIGVVLFILIIFTIIGIVYKINKNKKTQKYDDVLFKDLEDIKLDSENLKKIDEEKTKIQEHKQINNEKTKELMSRATEALAGLDDIESLKKKFAPGTKARKEWIAKRKAEGKWSGPDE